MWKAWLDHIESGLVILLSGFVFWPNAVSSITLILLVIIRIARAGISTLPGRGDWMLFLPPMVLLAAWSFHGFADDGTRELQLWATWIGAIIYFKTSKWMIVFRKAFIIMSLAQAVAVLVFLSISDLPYDLGLSQAIRDSISERFHLHPTYLSAAWFWAALLLIRRRAFPPVLSILSAVLLILTAIFAGGKMPFLAFTVVLAGLALHRIEKPWVKAVSMAVISGFILVNIVFNPTISGRFDELTSFRTEYEEGELLNSTEVRLGVWRCTLSEIGEHLLWGVGVGQTRGALESCYSTYDQVEFFDTEFNTHNQYLHFWLSGGVLTFIAFLVFVTWLIIRSLRQNDRGLFYFLLYFFLMALTENYFSRQTGMMMWSFFVAGGFFFNEGTPRSATSIPSR